MNYPGILKKCQRSTEGMRNASVVNSSEQGKINEKKKTDEKTPRNGALKFPGTFVIPTLYFPNT